MAATLTTLTVFLLGPQDWRVAPFDYLAGLMLLEPSVASSILYHPGIQWIDGAYSSLWTEVCFYAWAASLYLLVRKKFVIVWLALVATIPLGLILSNIPVSAILQSMHLAYPFRLLTGYLIALQPYILASYAPYFTLGICAHEIWSKGVFRKSAIAGAAVTAAYLLYVAAAQNNIFHGGNVAATVCANLLMFGLFILFVTGHPLSRIFAIRPLVIVGQASYSLYLIHQNIGIAIMRQEIALGIPYLLVLPLTIAGMIAVSLLLFVFVEIPAKSWILRRSQKIVDAMDRLVPGFSYKTLP